MKVLFICKGNMNRSPIAAAIYNQLTHTHNAVSAGTYVGAPEEPEGRLLADLFPNPTFFEALEAHGVRIRENRTVKLTPEMLANADVVVSMAEEPFVPDFVRNNPKIIVWDVENPTDPERVVEELYQQLDELVKTLIVRN